MPQPLASPEFAPLEFTGERFVPWLSGEIAYEHWHRYAFARRFVAGRTVLDAACGEGYGTALLARGAAQVIGLDLDPAAVVHARGAYAGQPRLTFECGSVAAIPLPDASIDVIVSFETVEHLPAADQPQMIAEFARVLTPGGLLLISSPNRKVYSDDTGYSNPFHLHELYREEFAALLSAAFPHQRWFRQARLVGSSIWEETQDGTVEALTGDGRDAEPMPVPEGMYFITVAARAAEALPQEAPALSVYVDRDDSERKLAVRNAIDVARLDALARERDETIRRQMEHVRHLEELVGYRDRIVHERDAQLMEARQGASARADELRQLEAAMAAQQRLLAYRNSLTGWLRWPPMRIRVLWRQLTGR
jgi:SAM-dependent methyltransferase